MAGMQDIYAKSGTSSLIPEINEQMLDVLDRELARQANIGIDVVGQGMEQRGFYRSGQNLKSVSEQVLQPMQEQRRGAMLGMAKESAMAGREERLGDVQFERQRQMQQEQFANQLEYLSKQVQYEKDMAQLKADLQGGFWDTVATGFASGFGQMAGKGLYGGITGAGSATLG